MLRSNIKKIINFISLHFELELFEEPYTHMQNRYKLKKYVSKLLNDALFTLFYFFSLQIEIIFEILLA